VQRNSLLTARLHRLDFYVVLRKLIAELQAFSQCIQETSMVRFYSSIYADDKMLMRQMSNDSVFHGTSPPNRCRTSNEDRMPRQRSRPGNRSLIRGRNSLFLARRCDIWGESCTSATALDGSYVSSVGKLSSANCWVAKNGT
jgi:hypothetical protein